MTPIIASLPDPSSFSAIGWLVVTLAAVAVALNAILKLADRWKDKPPALEVRAELIERFTPKSEFNAHVAQNLREHENMFAKLGGIERGASAKMDSLSREWRGLVDSKIGELMASDNVGREKLHDRINEILREVSELRGELRARKQ